MVSIYDNRPTQWRIYTEAKEAVPAGPRTQGAPKLYLLNYVL